MTTSGIEPATFRLVAQCLNELRHQQRARRMYTLYIIQRSIAGWTVTIIEKGTSALPWLQHNLPASQHGAPTDVPLYGPSQPTTPQQGRANFSPIRVPVWLWGPSSLIPTSFQWGQRPGLDCDYWRVAGTGLRLITGERPGLECD